MGAFIGIVAAVGWLPSWTFSGILTPVGLIYVAAGWKSEPRRWLLWVGLLLNGLLLIATALVWLTQSG